MTTRTKTKSGKGAIKKLKLKKETIKNLDVNGKASKVKGGLRCALSGGSGCYSVVP